MRPDLAARRLLAERSHLLPARGLVRHPPAMLARSLELSRFAEPGPWYPMVNAAWSSTIDKQPGARLELGAQLVLGGWDGGPRTRDRSSISLGADSVLRTEGDVVVGNGSQVVLGERARMTLGADVVISSRCRLVCRDSITIGAGAGISWDALIMDTDYHALVVDGVPRPRQAPVVIGERVWVGVGAKILKGVTIGEGAVIASGAVVSADVPAHALVGGVPARVLRADVDWRI